MSKRYFLYGIPALIIVVLLGFVTWDYLGRPAISEPEPPIVMEPEPSVPTPVYDRATADDIVVTSIEQKDATTIAVEGQARGPWYFEASFPVEVQEANGTSLVQSFIMTAAEWMTTDFVPFAGDIKLPAAYQGTVKVILKKDNPSGDPVRDASVTYTLLLK